MTKSELLLDLESRDFIAWRSPNVKLDNADPEGFNWYSVRVLEQTENVGVYHQVRFYVVDEGQSGETAFYQGADPGKTHATAEFKKWIYGQYTSDLSAYEGLVLLRVDEIAQSAYYTILEPVSGSVVEQKIYYVRRFSGEGPKEIQNFNINYLGGPYGGVDPLGG